ncbi:MAG: CotH kinase family protein [Lachnospiraceae bacterium]|nr:CotH kinase family protein [Lachnospiraceae bacterium]
MKKYSLAVILSIPLLLLLSLPLFFTDRTEENQSVQPFADELSFMLSSGDGMSETIHCWEDWDGQLVVFLPSYARMSALTMKPAGGRSVSIDGVSIENGADCSWLELNTEYSLTDGGNETTIRFMQSENVATMYIETESGTIDNIDKDKTHKENANILLLTDKGEPDYRGDGLDKIRGHGNSTWKLDKKPYNVYLSEESDLLGMGSGSKWVLLANAYDSTNLRNKVIFDFADKIGSFEGFSPHASFVDLYLNGDYTGLYLLTEHMSDFHNTEVLPDNGVLFHTDRYRGDKAAFEFNGGVKARVVLPESADRAIFQNLKNSVMQFQEALLNEDPDDHRWMDSIDIDSFARKYLVEEIFANNDTGISSQYFIWNDLHDRLYAGPCWDYDDTYGEYLNRDPRSFLANREWGSDEAYTPWFHALMEKPEFREKVMTVYRDCCLPELEWLLASGSRQYTETIRQASLLNELRWDLEESEIGMERDLGFLKERIDFLNSAWIEGKSYHTITLKGLKQYRFLSIPDGEDGSSLPPPASFPLPDYYDVRVGDTWYYEGTGEPFDPSAVITDDITLYTNIYTDGIYGIALFLGQSSTKPCIAALTVLIMIVFMTVMLRAGSGRNPKGKGWCEHGIR